MAVNVDRMHKLFMSGLTIEKIASELGITKDSCQTYISIQRKKDPFAWPRRKGPKGKEQASSQEPGRTYMHLYECTDCFCIFGVEDYEGIDQSVIECPHCHNDELIEDAGYGFFTVTKLADGSETH